MSFLSDLLGGPKEQTVTNQVNIPPWLRPLLDQATETGGRTLSGLEGYLQNTGLLGNSPMSFLSPDARGTLEGLSTGTAPSLNALSQTAAGDFLHGGSGFNAALESAQRQIQPSVLSAFGRGGAGAARGGLAQTAMTRAIADAFAGLYGQERSNQLNASRSLGGLQLSAIPQLAGLNQMELNAPIDARSRLLGASLGQIPSLSPLFGSSQTQPIHSNPLGSILGLAGAGLGIADMFGNRGGNGGGGSGLSVLSPALAAIGGPFGPALGILGGLL